MKISDFSKAKEGDKVWVFREGWGTFVRYDDESVTVYLKHRDNSEHYVGTVFHQTFVFWDELKFETPPPFMKKNVKKTCWINIFKKAGTLNYVAYDNDLYDTQAEALREAFSENVNYEYVTTAELEFEVEE